jgi:hypothetical protein
MYMSIPNRTSSPTKLVGLLAGIVCNITMTGPRDHTKWTAKEQPITRMADSIVWGKQWKAKDRSSPSGTHLARQAYRSLLYTADEHQLADVALRKPLNTFV